jgi:tryptophan 2,3-dioxygenase
MSENKGAGTYGKYLKVPELLSLQRTLSDPPQHDETLFIIIHQVYELWFKQMLHEVGAVAACLSSGDTKGATRLCRRLIEIQRVLVQQVAVLETMTPPDFMQFREHLNPPRDSSRTSSGARVPLRAQGAALPEQPRGRSARDAHAERRPRRALAARSMGGSSALAWAGVSGSRGIGSAEVREAKTMARMRSLLAVYGDRGPLYDLYILAEAFIEYDENFTHWRQHHVLMVERMIGMKQGTGGSEGVGYLRTTLAGSASRTSGRSAPTSTRTPSTGSSAVRAGIRRACADRRASRARP